MKTKALFIFALMQLSAASEILILEYEATLTHNASEETAARLLEKSILIKEQIEEKKPVEAAEDKMKSLPLVAAELENFAVLSLEERIHKSHFTVGIVDEANIFIFEEDDIGSSTKYFFMDAENCVAVRIQGGEEAILNISHPHRGTCLHYFAALPHILGPNVDISYGGKAPMAFNEARDVFSMNSGIISSKVAGSIVLGKTEIYKDAVYRFGPRKDGSYRSIFEVKLSAIKWVDLPEPVEFVFEVVKGVSRDKNGNDNSSKATMELSESFEKFNFRTLKEEIPEEIENSAIPIRNTLPSF